MYSSVVLRQTHQTLVVQFTELQNLRSRVLKAEQRLLAPRRPRAHRRRALRMRPLVRMHGLGP